MNGMTATEFAKLVGASAQTIYNRINKGQLDYPLTQEKADNFASLPKGRPARR